jgi:nitrogen fixation protein FixH
MKKNLIIMFVILICTLVFISGCVDYKAYEIEQDASLVDEIAQIENELANENSNAEAQLQADEVVEEDVVLPSLGEEENNNLLTIKVKENEMVRLNAKIVDPDKDPVTYSYTAPINQRGEWKTNYGDAGEYLITLSATDGKLTTTQEINLVVERVNVAPIITGVRDLTVREGELVAFLPKVSDPNNDKIEVTVSEPLKSGEFKTDHTSSGEYFITVVASDGELETQDTFKLMVMDVNERPIITGLQDVTISEGETVNLKPEVSDLDGDDIKLTISEPIGNDGVWETSYTDHGEFIISVTADDGKDRVVEKVKVIVEDINKAPQIISVELQ